MLYTKAKEKSTHAGLLQFLPFGIEVEHHSFPRSWQSCTADHKNQQHHVRQGGSYPYYLRETREDERMQNELIIPQNSNTFHLISKDSVTFPEVLTPFHKLK